MKLRLFVIILLPVLAYAQTVNLSDIEISIGDSLSQVIGSIDTNYYSFSVNRTGKDILTGMLFKYDAPFSRNVPKYGSEIGRVDFQEYEGGDGKNNLKVQQITKIWWRGTSLYEKSIPFLLIQKYYDLLESSEFDEFDKSFGFSKHSEPENNSYHIWVKSNKSHYIKFFYDKSWIELSEVFTRDISHFCKHVFYVVFDNYKRLSDKNSDLIVEKFNSKGKAERRVRELLVPHLMKGLEMPQYKILRFEREE